MRIKMKGAGLFSFFKVLLIFLGAGVSALYLMLSLTEIALHQYFKSKSHDYVKTTFIVDHYHHPMWMAGRGRSQKLLATGTVDGDQVKIPLKSLLSRIQKFPRKDRIQRLRMESKTVPVYKRKSDITSRTFQGRSLSIVEADYFENGSHNAWHYFLTTLIITPLLFLWCRAAARKYNTAWLADKERKRLLSNG